MKKWTGIKKAVSDSKRCGFYAIMANIKTKEVWCNQFDSNDDWCSYGDSDIVKVAVGNGEQSLWGYTKITMVDLKALLERLEEKHYYFIGHDFSETTDKEKCFQEHSNIKELADVHYYGNIDIALEDSEYVFTEEEYLNW